MQILPRAWGEAVDSPMMERPRLVEHGPWFTRIRGDPESSLHSLHSSLITAKLQQERCLRPECHLLGEACRDLPTCCDLHPHCEFL